MTLSLKDTDPPSPTPHPYPKQFLQPNPSQEPQTLPTASASLPTIFAPPLYLSVGPARRSHGPRCLPHHVGVTVLEARGHVPPPQGHTRQAQLQLPLVSKSTCFLCSHWGSNFRYSPRPPEMKAGS